MRLGRLLFTALALGAGGIFVMLATKHPSNDRQWAADQARLPEITALDDSTVEIAGVRDFHYQDEQRFEARYRTKRYHLDRVSSVWLILAPFSKSWRGPAHAFVSFGFDDSTYLAVSIEARREVGEEYGVLSGLGRNYELIYVFGEERDLIGKRALGDFDLYLYPIRAEPAKVRAMLSSMLDRARTLRTQPEFYNTVTNSCTSNLVAHVNTVRANPIPMGLKLIFPGYADEVAVRLGLIAAGAPLDTLRRRYRINEAVRRFLDSTAFSERIRDGLR